MDLRKQSGFLIFLCTLGLGCGQRTELPPVNRVPLEERLWTIQIANGRPPSSGLIATLHSAPDSASPVVATVFQEGRRVQGQAPQVLWTVEHRDRPGVRQVWADGGAAFDYGLHLAGVQRRGDWVRLLASIPVDGWLRLTPDPVPDYAPVYIYILPLSEDIVTLTPLAAEWPDGSKRQTALGTYRVVRVRTGTVEFREEVPSDFSCEEGPVVDPVPMPPVLRAPTSELFNSDGTPRFSRTYTKGC